VFCFEFKNVCFNNITITKNENNKTSLETNFNPIVINQSTFTIGPPLKSMFCLALKTTECYQQLNLVLILTLVILTITLTLLKIGKIMCFL